MVTRILLLKMTRQTPTAKGAKGKTTRRRAQAKKRHYTEDSIRLYLQEIGRIRLLRAEEEIELARKIADLLKLERIFDDLFDSLEEEISKA
jgi:RNA polymerase primary sigma factor